MYTHTHTVECARVCVPLQISQRAPMTSPFPDTAKKGLTCRLQLDLLTTSSILTLPQSHSTGYPRIPLPHRTRENGSAQNGNATQHTYQSPQGHTTLALATLAAVPPTTYSNAFLPLHSPQSPPFLPLHSPKDRLSLKGTYAPFWLEYKLAAPL